jgi:uncharacterized membrane protein
MNGRISARVIDSSVRRLAGIVVAALAGLWAYAAATFQSLPARYPVHFDGAGHPNGWATDSSPEWFLLPAIATLVTAFTVAMALLMPRMPMKYVNIPRKECFLALPEASRAEVLRSVVKMVLVMGILEVALFGLIQVMMFKTAVGEMREPRPEPLFAVVALILVVAIGWTIHLSRRVRELSARSGIPQRPPL